MMKQKQIAFPLAVITAAVLGAYSPAYAQQDPEIERLTKPSSTVSIGAGYLSADAPRFGQYTGINEEGAYGLLDADINKRDDSTGTWIKFRGRNLGQENRDLRFSHERQGDWGYYLDYSETPRFEPYTVNTAVTGIGTPSLVIPSTAAPVEVPLHLKMKREALGLGYSKIFGNGFDVQVRVRNEEKDGARIFSRGTSSGHWEFAPEPINSTTSQLDAVLGYSTKKLYLAGSYYGSWYNNRNTALNIAGGNSNLASFNAIGLPPDSQAHQLALSGNYSFTSTTKANFKAAYTRATQDDTFISGVTVAPGIAADGNLDGRVDTTLLQFGVSARPTAKLSLLADARYEDRDDKTPVRQYTNTTVGLNDNSTFDGFNEPRSIKTTSGKVEASYRLPMEMRLTSGVEYVEKERNTSNVRAVGYREKTEEISYRLVLQRALSETVAGSVGLVHSDRDGSDFLRNFRRNGTTEGLNLVAPLHLADRTRDKLRLSLNWTPAEQFSVQYQAEVARDDYAPRDNRNLTLNPDNFEFGLRDGTWRNHSIDISYAFSDEWQANAWISKNDTVANRGSRNGPAPAPAGTTQRWVSTQLNNANSFGLGLRGKPVAKLEFGADLSHSEITDVFGQSAVTGTGITSLPNFYTRQSSVKLFGTYAVQKSASIRLDYMYDRYRSNDWTWSQWTYTDGTTLAQAPKQNVNFFGITYIYRFY